MSNFTREEYCRDCRKKTPHYWLDNVPIRRHYTVKCTRCGLLTDEDDWKEEE